MKYSANPLIVDAFKIIGVGEHTPSHGRKLLIDDGAEGGTEVVAASHMKTEPKVGDYWVVQEGGVSAISPKAAFESKYTAIETPEPPLTNEELSAAVESVPLAENPPFVIEPQADADQNTEA